MYKRGSVYETRFFTHVEISLYRQYFREPKTQFNTLDHAGANFLKDSNYNEVNFYKQNDFAKK